MKSDKKTSIRLPAEQMMDLDKICKKNGNCSRANVIKESINQVTKGTSSINFRTDELDSFLPKEVIDGLRDHTWEIHKIGDKLYRISKKNKAVLNDIPEEIKQKLQDGKLEVVKTEYGSYKIRPKGSSKPQVIIKI